MATSPMRLLRIGPGLLVVFLLAFLLGLNLKYGGDLSLIDDALLGKVMLHSHMLSDWLFLQVSAGGGNGYEVSELNQAASLVGVSGYLPLARLTPPWYFIFFSPFAVLSPVTFLMVTTLLNAVASIWLVEKCFYLVTDQTRTPFSLLLTATVLFPPLICNVEAGQAIVFVALAMVKAFLALKDRDDVWAGFWLALLFVRPQNTLILIVTIMMIALTQRRYALIGSYSLTLSFLIGSSYLFNPASFENWWALNLSLDPMTLTLGTYIRYGLLIVTNRLYDWPVFAVPAIAALVMVTLILKGKISDKKVYTILPCISALTAPYGFCYDLTTMAPANVFTLSCATDAKRSGDRPLLIVWLTLNVSGLLAFAYLDYLSFWFYPLGLTVLTLFCHRGEFAQRL